jgi:glycosyltransferase involved in cell wall biosynthesis
MGYDAVIQCDADGQHNSVELVRLVEEAISQGADLVIGSRFTSSSTTMRVSLARRLAMGVMASVASRAAGIHLSDTTSGFRLFRGDLLRVFATNFPTYYLGDTFEATYVAGRGRYTIREIPVSMKSRANGRSSATRLASIVMIAKVLAVTVLGLHFRIPAKAE